METKIHRLPDTVINQIAAGEVVENPASIVKELIENSIDAKAHRITVEIQGGGQQLIRVEDDGSGMGEADARLSLERHATSKIQSVDDLQTLQTMGFRGEALAAISAVSHFELKTADGSQATRILAEGGKIVAMEPCARNRGTTIEIQSLFYNVPARKKFQKSPSTNAAQVAKVVEVIALAHPEVSFTFISQGKKLFEAPAVSSWKERVEEVLGAYPHEVDFQREGLKIWGLLASPDRALANRSGQYLFINRRPIFSPLIARAVKEGYGTRIPENAFPSFVLFLDVAPERVDINVHPQKKEARFREEGQMFRLFEEAVAGAFGLPAFSEPISFDEPPVTENASFPAFSFPPRETPSFLFAEETSLPLSYTEKALAVLGSFFLLEKEGWVLVDLQAAHARVLFETLQKPQAASQALIWPLEIELTRSEAMQADTILEELQKMQIECRFLGQKTLVIDALPPFLEQKDFPEFFRTWQEGKKLEIVTDRFCRSRKKRYSLEEARLLWQKVQECTNHRYDPLGHPIWKKVEEEDFSKWMRG